MRLEYEHTFEDKLAVDRARRGAWARVPGIILLVIFGGLFFGAGLLAYRSGVVPGWWVLPAVFVSVTVAVPFMNRWAG